MKPPVTLLKSSARKRVRLSFLAILLVSVKVNSVCWEQDCQVNKSIRIIDAKTGECISCYPCLNCSDGSPSVPCGSTVYDGTAITCDGPVNQDPVKVNSACFEQDCPVNMSIRVINSTTGKCFTCFPCINLCSDGLPSVPCGSTVYEDTVISCDGPMNQDPSISPLQLATPYSSHLASSVITATPSMTVTVASSLISAAFKFGSVETESKHVALSTSSTVNTASSKVIPSSNSQKQPSAVVVTVIGISVGVTFLLVVLLCIHKQQKTKHRRIPINASQNQQKGGLISVDEDSETYSLIIMEPTDTSSSTSLVNSCHKKSEENVNKDSHCVELCIGSMEWNGGMAIPTCLDSDSGQQNREHTPAPKGEDDDDDPEVCLDQPEGGKWSTLSQTVKYNTKMLEVPFMLLHKICLTLDIKRVDGNDIRQFADKLDISVEEFDRLEQMAKVKQVTTSEVILKEVFVDKHSSGTVGDFIRIMEDMGRDDIISLINAWE